MIELNERATQFLEDIHAEGERACAAVRAETDEQVAQVLKQTSETEQAKAARTAQFEAQRARTQANRSLSATRMQVRAALAQRRAALADSVFADAQQRLRAFTATPDYAAWLQNAAAELAQRLGAGTTIFARSADLPLLQSGLDAGCSLAADDGIAIGGLKAQNGAIAADDTLEARLAAQRDWFLQNAGLSIVV